MRRAIGPLTVVIAAALVVGALIARQTGIVTGGMRDIEYDALFGPYEDMVAERNARVGCPCRTESALIERVRSARQRNSL